MAERYDGTAWSLESLPQAGPNTVASLADVSCAAGHCVAVGKVIAGTRGAFPVAVSSPGTAWTLAYLPSAQDGSASLNGISCATADACTAVGSGGSEVLVDRWNGTSWSQQATPTVAAASALNGVSCPTPSLCLAVGGSGAGTARQLALAERWNGSAWTRQSAPTPAGKSAELSRISCSGPSACTAVGIQYTTGSTQGTLLVERFNGTVWTMQSTPSAAGSGPSVDAVSCPASNACVLAATVHDSMGNPEPLVERSNGTAWSIQSFPVPSGRHVSLGGVSCGSPSACTAVGGVSGLAPALAEHWNGSTWTIQSTPATPAPVPTDMFGVSCSAAGVCTAVGDRESLSDSSRQTLVERLSAGKWSVQASLNRAGSQYDQLTGVSCPSATACTTVGSYSIQTTQGPILTLAERWNGSSWSIQSSPNPAGEAALLSGISCPSVDTCTAVGHYLNQGGDAHALAETWNGASWAIQSIPSPAGAELSAVSCTAVNACTAVGDTFNAAKGTGRC